MSFEPYKAAQEIDDIFNKLVEENGVNETNFRHWLTVTRVVRTTVDLIETEARKFIKPSEDLTNKIKMNAFTFFDSATEEDVPAIKITDLFRILLEEQGK
jgi:hypothetical protein